MVDWKDVMVDERRNANWLMLFAPAAISAHADVKRSVFCAQKRKTHMNSDLIC